MSPKPSPDDNPKPAKNPKYKGRPRGSLNKAPAKAREALARFVDGNAHRLQQWLVQVADGVQDKSTGKWLVKPDPGRAFDLFSSVVEYHLPKLGRVEVAGDAANPIRVEQITRRVVHPVLVDVSEARQVQSFIPAPDGTPVLVEDGELGTAMPQPITDSWARQG